MLLCDDFGCTTFCRLKRRLNMLHRDLEIQTWSQSKYHCCWASPLSTDLTVLLAAFCISEKLPRDDTAVDFWVNFMKPRIFYMLEHVDTIICQNFIDIKLGFFPLQFGVQIKPLPLFSQAKVWGLFTRPTFSTTSYFVILCTEAWIQGCTCGGDPNVVDGTIHRIGTM